MNMWHGRPHSDHTFDGVPMTTLAHVHELMRAHGLRHLYAKILAANDNSKQQIYLGQSYGVLQGLPFELRGIERPTGRAELYGWPRFSWMNDLGELAPAPQTKFILYPQYPEVRLSGFLRGAKFAPGSLRQRAARDYPLRCLLLGVTDDDQVIGYLGAAPDPLVQEVASVLGGDVHVALREIEFDVQLDARTDLLRRLRAVHLMGWIPGQHLTRNGTSPYNSPNGGGYTLEAMFGIASNGIGEPDFRGWELKQHAGSVITLLTPEPTSGFYREHGAEAFVRRYGYADKSGKPDRLNFGGVYRIGRRHATTGLTLELQGFDVARQLITAADGGVALVTDQHEVAARWEFGGLLAHWARKHASAAYVSCVSESVNGLRRYSYGAKVQLGEGTDFLRFLNAIASGRIYLDPATKVEHASSARPTVHARNQFRVRAADLASLYGVFSTVDVSAAEF